MQKAINNKFVPAWNRIAYTNFITRLEVCQLVEAYIMQTSDISNGLQENPFSDTADKSVRFLSQLGIVQGKSETEFAPYDLITREEFATILLNVYNCCNDEHRQLGSISDFQDAVSISPWAIDAVNTMHAFNIMLGDEKGMFWPQKNTTKEEVIACLLRMFETTIDT